MLTQSAHTTTLKQFTALPKKNTGHSDNDNNKSSHLAILKAFSFSLGTVKVFQTYLNREQAISGFLFLQIKNQRKMKIYVS